MVRRGIGKESVARETRIKSEDLNRVRAESWHQSFTLPFLETPQPTIPIVGITAGFTLLGILVPGAVAASVMRKKRNRESRTVSQAVFELTV